MKTRIFLLAVVATFLTGCASMSPEAAGALAVSGASALVGFVDALSPMLHPEQQAELLALAGNIDTVVQAASTAMGSVAETVADLRAEVAAEEATDWSGGEISTAVAAAGAASVGASRALSSVKHSPKANKA